MTSLLIALLAGQNSNSEIEALIRQFQAQNGIVGMTVAVYSDDKLAYHSEWGFQDREASKPANRNTLIRLASVSKPICAVGLMKQVELGKVNIDVDARPYLPGWPKDKPTITLRQLMSHTSGFRHYVAGKDPDGKTAYASQTDAARLFMKDDLLHAPGSKYQYSTHAFTLVAAAAEKAAGTNYASYMRQNIFKFAGSGQLDCEIKAESKPNRSELYTAKKGAESTREKTREDISWKWGGGGLEATAIGLAKWGNDLMRDRILRRETKEELWKPIKLSNGSTSSYGLGFALGKQGVASHSGAQQGSRTGFYIDYGHKVVVTVLCNTAGDYNPESLAGKIAAYFD